MERNLARKWIIVLVGAFDDADIETAVIKEEIDPADSPEFAALLRGGELIDVIRNDDESVVEGYRLEVEKTCLRG